MAEGEGAQRHGGAVGAADVDRACVVVAFDPSPVAACHQAGEAEAGRFFKPFGGGEVIEAVAEADDLRGGGAVDVGFQLLQRGPCFVGRQERSAAAGEAFGFAEMQVGDAEERLGRPMQRAGGEGVEGFSGKGKSVGKPYVIKARKGGALSFGGKVREEVVHPGIAPRPFMQPAVQQLGGPAIDVFVAYMQKRLPKEIAKAAA